MFCCSVYILTTVGISLSAADDVADRDRAIYLVSGRPLGEAVRAIGEDYGIPIAFEEASYAPTHPLRPIFPGSSMSIPTVVRVDVAYKHSRGVKTAVENAIAETSKLLPERYRIYSSPDGSLNIVPDATGEIDASYSILDGPVSLPSCNLSSETAIHHVISQINTARPGVEVEVDSIRLSDVTIAETTFSSARDLLNAVTQRWTGLLAQQGRICTWTLRYGPELSNCSRKVFLLAFLDLVPTPRPRDNYLVVESAHPLADAITVMEDHYEAPIIFEEPAVQCDCALLGHPGTGNVALAGGKLRFQWNNNDAIEEVLARLLEQLTISFQVFASDVFNVHWSDARPICKPHQMRTGTSTYEGYRPLLDTPVGSTLKTAHSRMTISEIAELISIASGQRVVADQQSNGARGDEFMLRRPFEELVTVQDVLVSVEGATNEPISFHLLYDPSIAGHRLTARTVLPTGK